MNRSIVASVFVSAFVAFFPACLPSQAKTSPAGASAATTQNTATAKDAAQEAMKQALLERKCLASGGYCPYQAPQIKDTPAPKGYKAFYVNHYGRHGSRYQETLNCYVDVVPDLDKLFDEGALTEEGATLHSEIKEVYEKSVLMTGMLTQTGCEEHRGISSRLCSRYPEIFTRDDAHTVSCISSDIARCVMSMANFVSVLKTNYPALEVSMDAGRKYKKQISAKFTDAVVKDRCSFLMDSLKRSDPGLVAALSSRLFITAPEDPAKFLHRLFKAATTACCIEGTPDILRHFTPEEILYYYKVSNLHWASRFALVTKNGVTYPGSEKYIRETGSLVGKFMTDQIERALTGNGHCADFNFGHDTGLAPFLSFLQPEGYPAVEMEDSWYLWPCAKNMPMGFNVQFIFYRKAPSSDGDILFKMLVNEKETMIPALKPVHGPYYKWNEMKDYMLRRSCRGI